mgnify:CR=1 FL=1
MSTATAAANIGHVIQVIGPVLDVEFAPEKLPDLYSAIEIKNTTGPIPVSYTHLTLPTNREV